MLTNTSNDDDENKELKTIAWDVNVIPFAEFSNFEEIGAGGSGALVLKATWKQQPVVVKLFKTTSTKQQQQQGSDNVGSAAAVEGASVSQTNQEFRNEFKLLASMIHPHIISLYGVCLNAKRVGVVMEYCENGSLKKFIQSKKISWVEKLQILLDVAKAMQYLHGKNVIHRDLKRL